MQVQNRMKYDNTFNTVVSESIYDFRNPEIQSLIEDSYEQARQQLILQGGPGPGTTIGGLYGVFEWKTGNSYAYRVPDSGMRKLETLAKSTSNKLFEY